MSLREDVITVLQAISSRDHQYDWYRATEGSGNLTRELWSFWMRDAYLPHHRDFSSSFSCAELEQLERFTQFFEARLTRFPDRFEDLMTDIYWLSVVEYAEGLLEDLAAEENGGTRSRLANLTKDSTGKAGS